jgi:arginine-tRNA-protein transferase
MRQCQYARRHGLIYQYLGYWIAECPSMAYKSNYRPHEVLARYPADGETPVWERMKDEG